MRFNDLLNKLSYQLRNFYGWDRISKYSFIAGAICLAIKYLFFGGLVLIGYSIWRGFSKNRDKRYAELQLFNQVLRSLSYRLKNSKSTLNNAMQYKVFKCPSCSQKLRVPRKKGKLTITCRKCGNEFKGKS